ncbi:MAG: hypothetical protein U1D97_15125 [Desulfuromonadales bacterium]|nr:hypothetical protein [Desulfuromonadales bacterium]
MTKKLLATLSLLLLAALPASAVEKKGIELKSTAEVDIIIKNDKGVDEVVRVAAADANVTPGDTVIFTTGYHYQGEKPATNVVINNPLPEHMLYLDGTAEGQGTRIEFSVDKGQTFAAADKLMVKDAEGKEQPASAADYTHIRWTIEGALQDGAKGSVLFKAKVK